MDNITQQDKGLSVQEAALQLRVSEKTIRRRIKQGLLNAHQQQTPNGFKWCVQLDSKRPTLNTEVVQDTPRHQTVLDSTTSQTLPEQNKLKKQNEEPILAALQVIEKLQQDNIALAKQNEQLAGQIGFYQAKLQDTQEQLRLLTQPNEPPPQVKPWWKKLLRKQ